MEGYVHSNGILDMKSRGATHNVHANKNDWDGSHIACVALVKETNGELNLQYESNSELMVI